LNSGLILFIALFNSTFNEEDRKEISMKRHCSATRPLNILFANILFVCFFCLFFYGFFSIF